MAAWRRSDHWRDWRWQMRHRLRSAAEFRRALGWAPPDLDRVGRRYPVSVTPYYASLIRTASGSDPVARLCLPQVDELTGRLFREDDPFRERDSALAPGVIRRYRDRALVLSTTSCAVYCRHCTRKHTVGAPWPSPTPAAIRRALAPHPEIREVLVSGGDPLTLSTPRLESILRAARSVPSVELIRIGSRVPVTLPQRITPELVRMLRRYQPVWLNTHFNHPAELTPEAATACAQLADAGIPLGNQAVLLRGVNDSADTLETLFRGLLLMRVRPYYLLQADPVRGTEHFRTPVSAGLAIVNTLRGRLTGLAIPTYVVDAPDGGGKIPLLPTYIEGRDGDTLLLRTPDGRRVRYPDPGTA